MPHAARLVSTLAFPSRRGMPHPNPPLLEEGRDVR
ncbi:MAG: hypothetical protein KatS3mg058_1418 [Roseiflexus sp.]|nr:MAG: hypothetical protein KatS3mg058_1418 [Roseiflexus sp.]